MQYKITNCPYQCRKKCEANKCLLKDIVSRLLVLRDAYVPKYFKYLRLDERKLWQGVADVVANALAVVEIEVTDEEK